MALNIDSRLAGCHAAALALTLLTPTAGFADAATLTDSSICSDPSNSFDYHWVIEKHGSTVLFFIQDNGAIVRISQNGTEFNDYNTIYISFHGSPGRVGPRSGEAFAHSFMNAHADAPALVYFLVCRAGATYDKHSVLGWLDSVYGQNSKPIQTLAGTADCPALQGDPPGSNVLRQAKATSSPQPSDAARFDLISRGIMKIWTRDFENKCKAIVHGEINPTEVYRFMEETFSGFANGDPNYLDLIGLNTKGTQLDNCGAKQNHQNCDW